MLAHARDVIPSTLLLWNVVAGCYNQYAIPKKRSTREGDSLKKVHTKLLGVRTCPVPLPRDHTNAMPLVVRTISNVSPPAKAGVRSHADVRARARALPPKWRASPVPIPLPRLLPPAPAAGVRQLGSAGMLQRVCDGGTGTCASL